MADRTFGEYWDIFSKLVRGIFKRHKIDEVGNLFRVGKGVQILKKNGKIKIGDKVQLHHNVKLSVWGTDNFAALEIGNNTNIGDRTEIHAGKSVKIGNNCNISWDCCIMDRDYHKFNSEVESYGEVVIEDNVWIGCRSMILKGVRIGEGAVVAAESVVTKDVPPKTVVGGNPAKVLKEGIYWKP